MSHEKRLTETISELSGVRARMRAVLELYPFAPPGDACSTMWTAARDVALVAEPEPRPTTVLPMGLALALDPVVVVSDDYQPDGAA